LLRPVARFCLREGIPVQSVLEAMKSAFVNEAARTLRQDGHKVNASRISAMTGLQRRDATRLLEEKQEDILTPSVIARVALLWSADKTLRNSKGEPRALRHEGDDSEFAALVGKVSSDLNPGTVLFELERLGIAKRDGAVAQLVRETVSTSGDADRAYSLLALEIDDLLHAVEANVTKNDNNPHLHARTEFDNIAVESLPKVKSWLLDQGSRLHKRARVFLAQYDKDLNPQLSGKGGGKVSLGTFSFSNGESDA
jgi:hypothetical protein